MFFRLFFIFAFYFLYINAFERIICNTSHSINLNENEIVFFESPGFPKTMNQETKENCELRINGTLTNKNNMSLIFAVTNGHPVGGQIFDNGFIKLLEFPIIDYYYTNSTSIRFSFANNETREEWEGFQGFITYEKRKSDGCPLANRIEPFTFSNESEVLYLRSSYFKNLTDDIYIEQEKQCIWKFIAAPKGYSFKILTLFAAAKVLVITNDSRQYIQSNLPFYFNTNNLTLVYTANYENELLTDKAFLARISIVNLIKNESNDYCTLKNNGNNELIWSTPANKYTTKVKCQKSFIIKPGHQLYAHITSLETTGVSDIKTFMDVLRYYVDEDLFYPVPIVSTGLYAFVPFNNNETQRNVTFEYTSDESLVYKGFAITFKDVECICAPSKFVIPCFGEKNYSVMPNNDFYYCADMCCPFEIIINESCPNNLILLKIYFNFDENFAANLQVKSVEKILINTDGIYKRTFEGRNQKALIFPNRKTTLKFKSSSKTMGFKSVPIGSIRLWATSFEEPKHLPKQLITLTEPLYVFKSDEIPSNHVLSIELSKELLAKNATLEMFYETSNAKHFLHCFTFYSDEAMENIIKFNLVNSNFVFNNSITIYKHVECENDLTKLYIRAKNVQSKNCLFQNNIVKIGDVMRKNKKISMVSGSNHSCELTILNNMGFNAIKEILTTNYMVLYNNQNTSHKMLEFNRTTASKWNNMTFNSFSYLIVIPPSSSLLIEFYDPLYYINFTKPLLSYYETPFYGTPSFKNVTINTLYKISSDLEAIFTVVDMDISSNGILQLVISNGTVVKLNSIGQKCVVNLKNDQVLNIYYHESEYGFKGAMIEIKVQSKSVEPQIIL